MNNTKTVLLVGLLAGAAVTGCDTADGPATGPAENGTADVVFTRFERNSDGKIVAKDQRVVAKADYDALVAKRLAAMKQQQGGEPHQQALYAGTALTNGDQPGWPCDWRDVWLYDIKDGWANDGRARFIGCFRTGMEATEGCTRGSTDSLNDAWFVRWEADVTWSSMVQSVWNGPCHSQIETIFPLKAVGFDAWAKKNVDPPYERLAIHPF